MKLIVFSGYLQEMYPEGIRVEGDSAAECISALRNFPGFREEEGVRHTVALPHFQSRDALFSRTDMEEIHVAPLLLAAGGRNGFGQVILGAVLIVTGLFLGSIPGFQAAGAFLVKAGAALVIGGIIQMLMPQPSSADVKQEERSRYLPAGRNTTKVGTRIPLLFGRRKVWGHYLAFNVSASNLYEPAPPPVIPEGGFSFTSKSDLTWQVDDGTGGGGT